MTAILISLGVVLFLISSYFIGNTTLQTFHCNWRDQFLSSLYGALLWVMIAIVLAILSSVVVGLRMLFF